MIKILKKLFFVVIVIMSLLQCSKKNEIIFYRVAFNSNGSKDINAQIIERGNAATSPIEPTKIGYTFAGWCSDATLNTLFDFNTPITANITLYAK